MNGETSFGEWLRQQRKSLDLTQEALADQVGCSRDTIRKVELGIRRPSRQVADLLAECFGVPSEQRQAFVQFARGSGGDVPLPIIKSISHTVNNSSLRLSANPLNNLPAAPTPFIGREKELEKVSALIMREGVRMVTLTGPGGIGKTRLALRAAESLLEREDFGGGVFFVPLASIRDPELVVPVISEALSVREMRNEPLLETLKQYLRGKRMLLLLDNFEQIIAASLTVADLLTTSSALKIVVTSRELLGVQSEYNFPVPPLNTPDTRHLESTERLRQYEAVRLFIERAIAVRSDFAITNDNAPAVAEICVRLDGLPLAIELAAARVGLLTPQAMLSHLQDRLKLLIGRARDLPARQQTLRNTIEWSYDLLNEGEKQLFARMAVFQGGSRLEGIGQVCNAKGDLPAAVVDGVGSLVSKNLLRQEEGIGGAPRFWMLETIHEYASEKLDESGDGGEAAEGEAIRRGHALYFMALAEEAEPQLAGKQQLEWLDRLEEEHDNLRAALSWASEQGAAGDKEAGEVGLRTSAALARFWLVRGPLTEGREQLTMALSLPQAVLEACSISSRTNALNAAGHLATMQDDASSGAPLAAAALALGRGAGDKKSIALSLNILANAQSDPSAARSLYEDSLALRRELGDKLGIAGSLNNLGNVAHSQGDYPAARALYEESLALSRELEDTRGIAMILRNLGVVAHSQGDYPAARALYEESLAVGRELGDKAAITTTWRCLGNLEYELGDYPAALAFYKEALPLEKEGGNKYCLAHCLGGLGGVAAQEEQPQRAARLLGAAEELLKNSGNVFTRFDRVAYDAGTASARSHLGEEAFERARGEGRAMSIEQAVTYALHNVNGALNIDGDV